jgi:hypothetical protein
VRGGSAHVNVVTIQEAGNGFFVAPGQVVHQRANEDRSPRLPVHGMHPVDASCLFNHRYGHGVHTRARERAR